jgi:hypothetical protein
MRSIRKCRASTRFGSGLYTCNSTKNPDRPTWCTDPDACKYYNEEER